MANPRKFSEKIALQKQKQAEGTAEFERIMNEVKATRVVDNALGNTDLTEGNGLHRNASLSGGSGTSSGASGGGASPDANKGGGGGTGILNTTSGSPTAYIESRGRSMGVGPMRRPSERKQDRSPYGSTASSIMLSGMVQQTQNSYLSPPMDSSWRRSNSDSALHQTLNNLAEGSFVTSSPAPSVMGNLNSLHASYQHQQHAHQSQRSQSPNIGRSYSPQAQRRKNTTLLQQQEQQQLHHQQQQHQLHHQRLQIQQQQQQAQQQQHQQLQQHLQNQQLSLQQQQRNLHHQQQQQQQQYANAKYNNSNIMFKSLHEQQLSFNNTGSLPDLTSLHYSTTNPTVNSNQMTQSPTQQQQIISPILSPHHNNGCHDREQTSSPFSPPSSASGGNNGGGPSSPYHQQQNSPTSATNTPTANVQTSPHLSFTNLSVQSPANVQQIPAQNTAAAFSTLPTLGAASSTGNLTDYRQPLNPPSPGSSPGLLTSGPANEIHTSAPPSPVRHCQSNLNTSVSGENSSQTQQNQMPTQSLQHTFGNLECNASFNTLNPAFHDHFEQFNLGDNSHSPQNNYDALEFDDFGIDSQQQNNFDRKLLGFGDLTTSSSSSSSNTTRTNSTNTTSNCNNNNNLPQQQQHNNSQQFQHHHQQLLNNNLTTSSANSNTNTNGPSINCRIHSSGLMNNNDRQQDILSGNSSPIPSPLSNCLPSPSSPLPIPMSAHSPSHHQQLSLSVQTSPHHSPMHSPLHSPSPLSVSSPGQTMMTTVPSPTAHIMQQQQQQQQQIQHNHINSHPANQLHHNHSSHNNHHQQQNQTHTSTAATNIPQIIFSDYSSSRDIFDSLDLDLGAIDGPGLQMLSDQNTIMIADPSIEDSFRRDLN